MLSKHGLKVIPMSGVGGDVVLGVCGGLVVGGMVVMILTVRGNNGNGFWVLIGGNSDNIVVGGWILGGSDGVVGTGHMQGQSVVLPPGGGGVVSGGGVVEVVVGVGVVEVVVVVVEVHTSDTSPVIVA